MDLMIKELRKSYDRPVLKGINLDLNGYKSIGIIGKSGCGKSTLLRLLSGIEAGCSGTISIDGMTLETKNIMEYHKRISMIFQEHNLFPHLSLLRNITLILEKARGMDRTEADRKGRELLILLHLEEEMDKKPHTVSGGQAQRASIARALSTDPELIFMDEPTAALDPILTKEVLDAVLSLRNLGKNFMFVTHEIRFVRYFADYVLFMDEGVIKEQGTVDILTSPQSRELAEFLAHERF